MFKKVKNVFEDKQIKENKDSNYEKGDRLAIFIAAMSIMIPTLLGVILFFALIIWIFTTVFH